MTSPSHRENVRARMKRLARAAIAKALTDKASWPNMREACSAVKEVRDEAADQVVDLIWDWFDVRERKRKERKRRAGRL